jgi:hypothetical protein
MFLVSLYNHKKKKLRHPHQDIDMCVLHNAMAMAMRWRIASEFAVFLNECSSMPVAYPDLALIVLTPKCCLLTIRVYAL